MGFRSIMRRLDWPPIYQVDPEQFEKLAGWSIADCWGGSEVVGGVRIVAVHPAAHWRRRENCWWHEIGHHLWPKKPEWYITLFGLKMAGGGGVECTEWLRGHTLDDLPPRAECLRRAIRAAHKLRE